jgi:hypothetical protein
VKLQRMILRCSRKISSTYSSLPIHHPNNEFNHLDQRIRSRGGGNREEEEEEEEEEGLDPDQTLAHPSHIPIDGPRRRAKACAVTMLPGREHPRCAEFSHLHERPCNNRAVRRMRALLSSGRDATRQDPSRSCP